MKPSLPADYVVPEVWSPPATADGKFAGINRPTAGARSQATLPVGEHALQLYSLGTPNGQKVTILLEELGLEYDAWFVDIMHEVRGVGSSARSTAAALILLVQDQFSSGFLAVNPNGKIPALVDRSVSPPLAVFESGAIMLYLAEKAGAMLPRDLPGKVACTSWLMWQMGTAPYIGGGLGHFYVYAPVAIQYAIDRYAMETKRILDVLDRHLDGKEFMVGGECSIADLAIMPWIRCIDVGYGASTFVGLGQYGNVARWLARLLERPAVQRGLIVNTQKLRERHSPDDFAAAIRVKL